MNESGLTLTQKLTGLNNADLSGLRKRIEALRAQAEADLKRAGATDKTATTDEIKNAAKQAGVTVEEFMAALERAKKMGLI